jgi:hypothetical protein
MFAIELVAEYKKEFEFPVARNPNSRGHTSDFLTCFTDLGMRGPNVVETLSLGLKICDQNIVGLGQPIKRPFGTYALCIVKGAIILLPYERVWPKGWLIPAVRGEDPLLAH